jgi:hypothetical protein
MSNNKQSMKLYTKEDFLKAAEFCEVSMIDAKYIIERIDEVSDPIELPSDEEIENMGKDVIVYNDTKRGWFVEGLRFMRDKIQGGNNEQPK